MKHKHQWIKVGSTWNGTKLIDIKKRCRTCGKEKVVKE